LRRVTQQNQTKLCYIRSQKAFLRFVYGEKIEDRRAEEDERVRESLFFLSAPRFAFSFGRGIIRRARETHFGRAAAPANEEKAHREEEEEEEEEERGERKLRG